MIIGDCSGMNGKRCFHLRKLFVIKLSESACNCLQRSYAHVKTRSISHLGPGFFCPCVGPFPFVGLTLTWFIWGRNLALHITRQSVKVMETATEKFRMISHVIIVRNVAWGNCNPPFPLQLFVFFFNLSFSKAVNSIKSTNSFCC